jgi:hypothetical protein
MRRPALAAREQPFRRGPVIADRQPGGRTRPRGRGFTVAGQCRNLTGLRCAACLPRRAAEACDTLRSGPQCVKTDQMIR